MAERKAELLVGRAGRSPLIRRAAAAAPGTRTSGAPRAGVASRRRAPSSVWPEWVIPKVPPTAEPVVIGSWSHGARIERGDPWRIGGTREACSDRCAYSAW